MGKKDKKTSLREGKHIGSDGLQLMGLASPSSADSRPEPEEFSVREAEELLRAVRDMTDKVEDFQNGPLQKVAAQLRDLSGEDGGDDIVEYLKVKQQLLLAYCQNLVFYLSLKARGESVKSHPVMQQLLELRYAMEKMRPIDGKLHYQVDRLIKLSSLDEKEAALSALRPNPMALVPKDKEDDDDDDDAEQDENEDEDDNNDSDEDVDEDEDGGRSRRGSTSKKGERNASTSSSNGSRRRDQTTEKYRAPRMAAVQFKESESAAARRDKQLSRTRRKLKNSEIVEALREEFGSAPEQSSSSGVAGVSGEARRLAAEEAERREYEEDRMVRLTMSRKDKQDIRRRTADAQRLDNMDELGGFDDLEDLGRLAQASQRAGDGAGGKKRARFGGGGGGEDGSEGRRGDSSRGSAHALEKAVKAFKAVGQGDSFEFGGQRQQKKRR